MKQTGDPGVFGASPKQFGFGESLVSVSNEIRQPLHALISKWNVPDVTFCPSGVTPATATVTSSVSLPREERDELGHRDASYPRIQAHSRGTRSRSVAQLTDHDALLFRRRLTMMVRPA
jgi:hypothetical protein